MYLSYPFYVKQDAKLIKITKDNLNTSLDPNENIYVQEIDGNLWLVSELPININLEGGADKESITFGRLRDNDIHLSNRQATRHHCSLTKDYNSNWIVYDLNSKNGTFIDEEKVNHSKRVEVPIFKLKTGEETWQIDTDKMEVQTYNETNANFHKYPIIGGEKVQIGGSVLSTLQYDHGVSEHQGRRQSMEDQHAVLPNLDKRSIYMIFDGHGGGEASEFTQKKALSYVPQLKDHSLEDYTSMFETIDREFQREGKMSGTTANIVLVDKENINVVNAGDCQALILYAKENAATISPAHRPENELDRIPEQYLYKQAYGPMRVTSDKSGTALSVSRSIGDVKHDYVISTPDISSYPMNAGTDGEAIAVVQGCDGVWDFMSPDEVQRFVRQRLHLDAQTIAEQLTDEIYHQKQGKDNITIIVVKLK